MTARLPTLVYSPPPHRGLDLIFRDEAFLVVDKPSGLLSVPGRGEDKQDCLAARVQAEYPEALIVHRLDMETSGLLVLARGEEAHRRLSRLFRERQVDKRYIAVVAGHLEQERGEVDLPLITDWPNRPRQKVDFELGKPSLTLFRTLHYDPATDATRVELEPVTGRSHQLRVHMLSLGHPIQGDPLYGPAPPAGGRLLLHASRLAFPHPFSGEPMAFVSDPAF
jgi:tRNA pseudouridine32 synthase/23S rRNA pseudouridine746 synthase